MRPLHIWIIFGLSFAILLTALGWVTSTAVRLEQAQRGIESQSAFEEKVRLALWRMDSSLASLILQESSRPYFTYSAFFPAERAYNSMFSELQPNEVLLPSPLLSPTSTNVLLHFQYGPGGELTSPQVPTGNKRDLAESGYLSPEQIARAAQRLSEFRNLLNPEVLDLRCTTTLTPPTYSAPATPHPVQPANRFQDFADNVAQTLAPQIANPPAQKGLIQQQQVLNSLETAARRHAYQQASQLPEFNTAPSRRDVAEGLVSPIWFGDALVLARRVTVSKTDYIQGCWLDWNNIRSWLLANIHDLLPSADLITSRPQGPQSKDHLLASLPIQLLPGSPPLLPISSFSPIRYALLIAWLCVLLAGGAVALLLHGALTLSERRGAFVSAVTHELRTPLTTFRMYSEMLADGMVTNPAQRTEYLNTLCSEANRLGHLVENVLAYARLERGSARRQVEQVTLSELLQRSQPRLLQRCQQAGLTLQINASPATLLQSLPADVSAVEQILFNLVDNACKYAAPRSSRPCLELNLSLKGHTALINVRDYGPGISPAQLRRLFQPFSKSAVQAAHSAPGVGLGLALCRRLSRELGGHLHFNPAITDGASFTLSLPLK